MRHAIAGARQKIVHIHACRFTKYLTGIFVTPEKVTRVPRRQASIRATLVQARTS
jgi:hypothetical protein